MIGLDSRAPSNFHPFPAFNLQKASFRMALGGAPGGLSFDSLLFSLLLSRREIPSAYDFVWGLTGEHWLSIKTGGLAWFNMVQHGSHVHIEPTAI